MDDISSFLRKLFSKLSEENYDHTFSVYRFWFKLGVLHAGMSSDKLYNDILNNTRPSLIQASDREMRQGNARPDWVNPYYGRYDGRTQPTNLDEFCGKLIHSDVHLLLRFISDAELDPALSAYAIGLHDRLCRGSLKEFFNQSLRFLPDSGPSGRYSHRFCEYYTTVNLIAHWINLGCVQLEDIQDHILQSLIFQPTVHPHQLNSLMILLKISGATFAAYVDPSVMDRCCDLLKPTSLKEEYVAAGLAKVRTSTVTIKRNTNSADYRRFYDFGKAVGKDSLPLRSFAAPSPQLLSPSPRILRQLPSRHLWGSQARGNSHTHLPPPCPPQRSPQTGVRRLRLPHLHRRASPACPTSLPPIVSTTSQRLNPKPSHTIRPTSVMSRFSSLTPSRLTIPSTSTMGALKFYAARPSFASTPAHCRSTRPYSVKCFRQRISPPPSLPTGAHASYPPTHQQISRLS